MQTINSTLIDLWQPQDIVSFYIDLYFAKILHLGALIKLTSSNECDGMTLTMKVSISKHTWIFIQGGQTG